MTRIFGLSVCLSGFAAVLWTCSQDGATLSEFASGWKFAPIALVVAGLVAQLVGLQLLYQQDRQDLLFRITQHRDRIRRALSQMWSIKPEHHGEAQAVWTTEEMDRWGITLLGWRFAAKYLAWAMLFASGAISIWQMMPWTV